MNRFKPILASSVFGGGFALAAVASAQVREFNVPAMPARTAIQLLAQQSGVSILASGEKIRGVITNPVKGEADVGNALETMFRGTPLKAVRSSEKVFLLSAYNAEATFRPVNQSTSSVETEAPVQIAEAPGLATVPDDSGSNEIVVTGSLIRQSTTPSPTDVVDARMLDVRAVSNASELLRAVPANIGSEAQVDGLNQSLTAGTAQFNLRNLGLGSTLVLVNGRRHALSALASNDGSTFVDINSLFPLIAIQRVEIVKDGGAATYGSDAVAGVANFITRRSVDRPELTGRVNFLHGARQFSIEGIAGLKVGGGDLVVAASYYSSTRLSSAERSFSRASTFGRPSWHSVSSYGQPGSFFVPSLNRFVPDPDCANPVFQNTFQNSATDSFCRFDFSEYYDLLPKEQRAQGLVTYHAPISDTVNLNLEGTYAYTNTHTNASPSYPILAINPVILASHPDNPFGEDVVFRGRTLGGGYPATPAINRYNTFRLAAGLDGKLGGGWTWSVDTTYSQQTSFYDKGDTLSTPLQLALRGLGGSGCDPATGTPGVGNCQYFNPFGSALLGGTPNSPELIKTFQGSTGLHAKSSLATVEAVATGDIFSYDGGTIAGAVGVQYRNSYFRHDWGEAVNAYELLTLGQAPDFAGRQKVYSIFGELRVPFGSLVEAQISGRYEKYHSSFSNFSPKFALLARPTDWLSLRASYGKAFRAPSIYQQVAVQSSQPSVVDGGLFVFVNTQVFGDPNLKPEKSTNYNLGATLKPLRGLEFSGDFYSFEYKNLIVKENPQPFINQAAADTAAGLTNTPAQQRLVRDQFGTLQLIKLFFINASSVRTKGIDATARYTFDTDFGTFNANAAWNHIINYKIELTPGGQVIEGAGSVNFNNLGRSLPRNRVEYGVGWSSGMHTVNALGHYVGSYKNDRTGITQRRIKSWNTFDLQYVLTVPQLFGDGSTAFTVGAINVADKKPPLAQLNLGFDPIVHDPRGRVIYIAVSQKF